MIPIRVLLRRISGCQLRNYDKASKDVSALHRLKLKGEAMNFQRRLSCQAAPVKQSACRPLHTTVGCCKSKSKKYSGSENSKAEGDIDPDLKDAVQNVADSLPGDAEKTASDLLSQLRIHSTSTGPSGSDKADTKPLPSLGDLFSGMKIEKTQPGKQTSRSPLKSGSRGSEDRRGSFSHKGLFEGPGLGIFSKKSDKQEVSLQVTEESLWDIVEREELQALTKTPPTNSFEEMIQLTNEGKLWQFPINNEQGMDEEAKYGFQDHVFFDDLLEDFPQKGPVRHFMELVTTGLSKNPYLSVPEKREHIKWFRDYFRDKKHILDETIDSSNIQ